MEVSANDTKFQVGDIGKTHQLRGKLTDNVATYIYPTTNCTSMSKENLFNALGLGEYYYIGNHYETKLNTDDTTENTSYYFANGERMAKKDNSGDKYYYHPDHLGSTNLITNESGDGVETTKYYPFGDIRSGGSSNKFYFTGKEEDAETGLYYYGARYYAPNVRRWTQADLMISNIYNPQDWNRYSYTRNNPLRYTDPMGNTLRKEEMGTVKEAVSMLGAIRSYYSEKQDQQLTDEGVLKIAIDLYGSNLYNVVGDERKELRSYVLNKLDRTDLPRGITTKLFGDVDLAHAYAGYLQTKKTGKFGTAVIAGYAYEIGVQAFINRRYSSMFSVEDQPSMLFGDVMYKVDESSFGLLTPEGRLMLTSTLAGPQEPSSGYIRDILPGGEPKTINPTPIPYFEIPNPFYYIQKVRNRLSGG